MIAVFTFAEIIGFDDWRKVQKEFHDCVRIAKENPESDEADDARFWGFLLLTDYSDRYSPVFVMKLFS